MHKDKWKTIRDILVSNCKIVFPVLVVVLGAITVVIALNANKAEAQTQAEGQSEVQEGSSSSGSGSSEEQDEESRTPAEEVPMVANEDGNIYTLVETYYNAIGAGETDTLQAICHGISENKLIYYGELANYIDHYSDIDVYSKQGPCDGTTIVYVYYKLGITDYGEFPAYETLYVCTDEEGSLYIKNESIFSEEEKEYIKTANGQVDVVEFNNRVNAEYSELIEQNPTLLEYVGFVSDQLTMRVGEILSSRQIQGDEGQEPGEEEPQGESQGQEQVPTEQNPVESGPKYASATTTVNVRNSDSEQADKLGKVTRGTRLEVQEVRVNGWTKIVYDGKDGYIKSQYLQFEESTANMEVIGTVTATTNVNVRVAASESAERLGVLAGGSSLDLFGIENEWCKVNYNGQVGYVKADYVTQQ